jgi:hypothetical protein
VAVQQLSQGQDPLGPNRVGEAVQVLGGEIVHDHRQRRGGHRAENQGHRAR